MALIRCGAGASPTVDNMAIVFCGDNTNNGVTLIEGETIKVAVSGSQTTEYFSATASASSVSVKAVKAGKYRHISGTNPYSVSGITDTEVTAAANETLVTVSGNPNRYDVLIPLF